MAIFINAAHKEDIVYLDMAGLDMNSKRGDGTRYNYKDFVFTVQGEDLMAFRLQLAYTTNNQFTYEIYAADETDGGDYVVTYETTQGETIKYNWQTGTPIPMTYLNAKAGSGNKLADPGNSYNVDTYINAEGTAKYANVNPYAEPIYCHSTNAISVEHRSGTRFHNYFILRVRWDPEKINDKETDIVYIAAVAAAAG
jgi:hypothetical protein